MQRPMDKEFLRRKKQLLRLLRENGATHAYVKKLMVSRGRSAMSFLKACDYYNWIDCAFGWRGTRTLQLDPKFHKHELWSSINSQWRKLLNS